MGERRLGIFFNVRQSNGGIYQYSLEILRSLARIRASGSFEIVVFFDSPDFPHDEFPASTFELVNCSGVLPALMSKFLPTNMSSYFKAVRLGLDQFFVDIDRPREKKRLAEMFRSHKINLMFYPTHRPESFETGLPYVISIHDIQHRLQTEFPEVRKYGQWKRCEYVVKNAVNSAVCVVADSEIGKEDICTAYGIRSSKVRTLQYVSAAGFYERVASSQVENLRLKYGLPTEFAFYPAQFWPHKNHRRLILALAALRERHRLEVPLLLVGHQQAQWGEFGKVMSLIRAEGLSSSILYLSYLPPEEMPVIYQAARLLVFPTFFGPTNIPIVEAFASGCPVLTSDIRGVREQVGDAAILADPRSVTAIADGIHKLWTDSGCRLELIQNGFDRARKWNHRSFDLTLEGIISSSFDNLERGTVSLTTHKSLV